jgi:hypothetical protein
VLWLIRICFLLFLLWSNLRSIHSPAGHSDSWFRDGGFNLNTTEILLHGKKLYLDTFYQYGPLPITLYAFLSRFFGNTISTFSYYLLAVHLACIVLIFAVLSVARCDALATLLTVLALYPICAAPLGLHYSFEQLCILALIVLWQPLALRNPARSVLLGVLLGAMQWIRFGSALGPIIGLAAVDLLSISIQRPSLSQMRFKKLLTGGLFALGGFLIVESTLLIHSFVTLPGDVAQDTAWPYYMHASYNAYPAQDRHPRWLTLNYFLGNQLIGVAAFVCTAGCLLALLGSSRLRQISLRENQTALRLFIPFVAYLAYAAFFYQQTWHYSIGAWLLALSVGYYLRSDVGWRRFALAALFLPGLYVALLADFKPATGSPLAMTVTPRGERLWLPPETASRMQKLIAALATFQTRTNRDGVIFLERQPITAVSHLHFFYLIPQVIRHTMIFPGWLRDRDLIAMEQAIRQGHPVVLLQRSEQGPPPPDICLWNTYSFPREFCQRVSGMLLNPIRVDDTSWIFPTRVDALRGADIAATLPVRPTGITSEAKP